MGEQTAAEAGSNVAKTDGAMPKPPKLSKAAGKSKTDKEKLPKTSFSGRVEEVSIGDNDAVSFELKDKRGKRHKFILADASMPRLLLLASALSSKSRCHVETSAADRQLAGAVSLRGRK